MKKLAWVVLSLLVSAAGLTAQTTPQPAFRLLDGYLEQRNQAAKYGAKVGPWILMGAGLALAAGSATVWYASDSIAESSGYSPMTSESRFATTLGLAAGSVLLTSVGLLLHQFPPVIDERADYQAIYRETDPAAQETLAAARIKSLAETSRDTRIVSGWVNLGVVAASLAFKAIDNQDRGRSWSYKLINEWGWEAGAFLTGTTSLLIQSPEESLYEEYLYIIGQSSQD